MGFGKSIKIFLLDGTPSGRWICELSNWTGKTYKLPRDSVAASSNRSELKAPGVYFLIGKTVDEQDAIYIGESENVYQRLNEHIAGKEFWTEAIVFISKDDFLNKAHIKYMEHQFYQPAFAAKRYVVMNSSVPVKSLLSEAEVAEAEEFIENAKMILNTLGVKAFVPVLDPAAIHKNDTDYIINVAGVTARGRRTTDGFVVYKGSSVCKSPASSLQKSILDRREKLIENGVIDDNFMITEDLLFGSPSGASDFILGYSSSGPLTWKNDSGKSLKEIESAKA